MSSQPNLTIFYDGECPFCTGYARIVRLREAVGPVALMDCRSDDAQAERLAVGDFMGLTDPATDAPFPLGTPPVDFDAGFAVIHQGRLYTGADGVRHLALLTRPVGVLNRLNAWLFRHPRLTRMSYPVMKAMRNGALRLLGKPSWKAQRAAQHRAPTAS